MKKEVPEINPEKCVGCGDCVDECPTGAVALVKGKATVAGSEQCIYCTTCESVCLYQAIRCPLEILLEGKNPSKSKPKSNKIL